MPKKIIGIFHDPVFMKLRTEALTEAGFDVCTASNLEELKHHLQAGRCDLVVIGHTIPPSEKLRIGNFVRQYHEHCALLELYLKTPELNLPAAHVRHEDAAKTLVRTVHQLIEPQSICG